MAIEAETLAEAFGRRLRDMRSQVGLSQEALGDAAQLSRTSVVNIEHGRQGVSLLTLYRLADALHLEPAELLPGLPPVEAEVRVAIGTPVKTAMQSVTTVLRSIEEKGSE